MLAIVIGSLGIIVTVTAAAFAAWALYRTRSPYYVVVGLLFWAYFALSFVAPPPPFEALLKGTPYEAQNGVRVLFLGFLVAAIAASLLRALTTQSRGRQEGES